MQMHDFVRCMEALAPSTLALDFDNVGLLIEPERDRIEKVLVALDLTPTVAEEAIAGGYDLVLTHHPSLFHAVKRLSTVDPDSIAVMRLVRHGIGHFAAHTNLDAARGGVNDVICDILGLEDVTAPTADGILRIGSLPKEMTLQDFFQLAHECFGDNTRYCGEPSRKVHHVAVCGGAGDSEVALLKQLQADAFFTGEVRHNVARTMEALGIGLVVSGHYETERPVLKPLIARLQSISNGVEYILARSESSPFRCR